MAAKTSPENRSASPYLSDPTPSPNEALILGTLREYELMEAADSSKAQLQKEIGERRQMEAALRESERRYRTLFELGPVAVYTCDANGVIQQFNSRAAELWGRQPDAGDTNERFCGSFKLFRPDGRFLPHDRCPMADAVNGRIAEVRDAEVLIERPDGTRVTVVVNIRLLRNEQGQITQAINCFHDLTERKLAEDARRRLEVLAASNQKLEQEIVRRRTVEKALTLSKRHQNALLEHSRQTQEKLRELSRQVLIVQEEERKRISRELHDVVAQTLTGINVHLANLKKEASLDLKGLEDKITRTQQLVEKSVEIVHDFARELRPTVLDDLGLIPALQAHLKNLTTQTGVRASLTACSGVENLSMAGRTALFRVAQEAATNVARHARATHLEVDIRKLPGAICMKIRDNGRSFSLESSVAANGGRRLGLLGMRERLEMVGGTFAIDSTPGKGTTVTALIPWVKPRRRETPRPAPVSGPMALSGR